MAMVSRDNLAYEQPQVALPRRRAPQRKAQPVAAPAKPRRSTQSRLAEREARKARSRVSRINRLLSITGLVLIFGLLVGLVVRYSAIATTNSQIQQLKNDLAVQQQTTEKLQVQLAMQDNLGAVIDQAQQRLNMHYPADDQVRYIQVKPVEPSEAAPQQEAPAQEEGGLLNKLLDLFF
ncbi:MAG: hypothetical protein ACOYJA_06590 [Christensenellales bacterium]|jgi:cell division protein FtsL